MILGEELGTGEGSASNGMVKGLRLRFGRGRSSEGCLCLGWRCSVGEEMDFLGDGSA